MAAGISLFRSTLGRFIKLSLVIRIVSSTNSIDDAIGLSQCVVELSARHLDIVSPRRACKTTMQAVPNRQMPQKYSVPRTLCSEARVGTD